MFSLQNPFALLLLLLPLLLAAFRKVRILNRITFKAVLSDWNGSSFEYKNKGTKIISLLAKILTVVSYVLIVFAFSEPVISVQEKIYNSLGTDIIFVMDTSPSMMAKDMEDKTRLETSKNAIQVLLQANKGSRFGLVVLGSDAAVLVPPTFNQDYFNSQLEAVSVGKLGNGSAIGDGLATAVCHLASSEAPGKCIILLTDGENNAGEINPQTAAKLAAEKNINVYVVGLGTKGNVPIEYTDPVTGVPYMGYYNSSFDADSLKRIAALGKGGYYEAQTIQELNSVLAGVTKSQGTNQHFSYKNKTRPLYKKFLLIAIIAMLVSWFIKKIILRELSAVYIRKNLAVKRIFQLLYFAFVVLSFLGLSWGTYLMPVKQSSHAVSFVFDISNSMNALDSYGGLSRLNSASAFASRLIENMDGTSVSVILAKGDGIEAIPLTEDSSYINSLLEIISSDLVTVPGTSLENGIIKAKKSFPENYSMASNIWLFTDGEETLGQMEKAICSCVESGIGVTIIGFGSKEETEIFAGDKRTKVRTALREDKIKAVVEAVNEKYNIYKSNAKVSYINSNEKSSAQKLLLQIKNKEKENFFTTYEIKPLSRHKFFLALAFICLILSYLITEFNYKLFKKFFIFGAAVFILSSCSQTSTKILSGTVKWQQGQYSESVEKYFEALENANRKGNQKEIDACLYNLGTAYMMMGEMESAMKMYMQISTEAEDKILFSTYYNAGIIAHEQEDYDSARDFFKKALKIDSSRVDAKINFELSVNFEQADAPQKEGQSFEGSQNDKTQDEMEKAVFEHIKENDKKQWKSNEETPQRNLADDY